MFNKLSLALIGLSAFLLAACDGVTGTSQQAMTPEETGIISEEEGELGE